MGDWQFYEKILMEFVIQHLVVSATSGARVYLVPWNRRMFILETLKTFMATTVHYFLSLEDAQVIGTSSVHSMKHAKLI